MSRPFGFGQWSAYVADRGGEPLTLEMAWTNLSTTRPVNSTGSARLNLPASSNDSRAPRCEVVAKAEPWRDEIVLYRDDDLAFAGPLREVGGSDSPNCFAEDLFAWLSRRIISSDLHFNADVADVFHGIFDAAMEPDTSPNIEITTRPTGVQAMRDYIGTDLHPADGLLTELAKTALDFTMIGRRLLAGGKEVFLDDTPLLLHDDGCISADPVKDGTSFANDYWVLGDTLEGGGEPINGRATLGQSVYGLVQKVVTELNIRDTDSANANALSRARAFQPIPQRLKVVLSPNAPFSYEELIAGRRMDVRLDSVTGCMPIEDMMRIVQVGTEVSAGEDGVQETVTVDLVPLGLTEDDA